jgi:hypothetical protein
MHPVLFRLLLNYSVRHFRDYWQPEPTAVPEPGPTGPRRVPQTVLPKAPHKQSVRG